VRMNERGVDDCGLRVCSEPLRRPLSAAADAHVGVWDSGDADFSGGMSGDATDPEATEIPSATPADRPSRPKEAALRRGEVVVLLPALNEEGAIGHVIDRIPRQALAVQGYDVSVWVVDGQSTDRTMEIARERGASTFVQTGTGKGNAMRQALDHLLAQSRMRNPHADQFFVMLDADGSYPAEEITRFVEILESGGDIVLGSRMDGPMAEGAMSDMNRLGNRLLSRLATLLFHVPVTDVCTGMWGFRDDAVRGGGLVAEGFDLEADLFASACERKIRIREVPIQYGARIGEPKLVPLRTGLVIAWRLLMRRLARPATESFRPQSSSAATPEEAA